MTDKEKAIKALDHIMMYETNDSLKEYDYLKQFINQPTLDDCIAVVEKKFEKENERLRKTIQAYYSKSWLVTLSKNILAYNINFQMEIQIALKGLKEGK